MTALQAVLRKSGLRTAGAAILLLAALAAVPLAVAADVPGFLREPLGQPRLSGQGEYRWFGLKLYDARLWTGDHGYRTATPDTAPFALELEYARSFKGARVAEASIKEIRKLGIGTGAQHQAWLSAMERIFPDVREGTRIVGLHQPGKGAQFFLDGRSIGRIDDLDFSRAFFAIWLSSDTSAKELRASLLQNALPE